MYLYCTENSSDKTGNILGRPIGLIRSLFTWLSFKKTACESADGITWNLMETEVYHYVSIVLLTWGASDDYYCHGALTS